MASAPRTDMVSKALSLLTRLGDYPNGLGASELARLTGLPLSTAHRLLGTLVREGYVTVDSATKHYTIGIRVFQLAQSVGHARGFSAMTKAALEEVSAQSREATLLAVLDGQQLLYVHSTPGPQQVSIIGDPGRHGPLHCTSLGKVLIAFAPQEIRDSLIEQVPLTPLAPNTITDREVFRKEIERVRSLGYATADEEHEAGIRAISVPVRRNNTAMAALSAAAPAYRTSIDQLVANLGILDEAAKSLAAIMTP